MPATLLITESDRPVAPSPGRWLAGEICTIQESDFVWGSGELDLNKFLRFTVTNKSVAQMNQYLDSWNWAIDINVIAGPHPQGFRRINVRNNLMNASESIGAWTTEQADAIILEWNTLYPTTSLVTVEFPSADVWTCEGTFTTGQAAEFEEVVIKKGLDTSEKRRIWYITPAGMDNIRNAGGHQSGTSAQLSGVLRDGMLD